MFVEVVRQSAKVLRGTAADAPDESAP